MLTPNSFLRGGEFWVAFRKWVCQPVVLRSPSFTTHTHRPTCLLTTRAACYMHCLLTFLAHFQTGWLICGRESFAQPCSTAHWAAPTNALWSVTAFIFLTVLLVPNLDGADTPRFSCVAWGPSHDEDFQPVTSTLPSLWVLKVYTFALLLQVCDLFRAHV